MKLIKTINAENLVLGTEFGIFNALFGIDTGSPRVFEWLTEDLSKDLDSAYYLQHSGDKCISKFFERYIKFVEDGTITKTVAYNNMAKLVMNKFSDKWNKLYSAFIESTYKPLENYDMEQTETPNISRTRNVKSKVQTDNDFYGFNTPAPVKQSRSTVSGASLDNEESESETGTRGLTRHGNIGVTTSQQMLQSEIDLRNNFNFMEQIMEDVDSILCLLVY